MVRVHTREAGAAVADPENVPVLGVAVGRADGPGGLFAPVPRLGVDGGEGEGEQRGLDGSCSLMVDRVFCVFGILGGLRVEFTEGGRGASGEEAGREREMLEGAPQPNVPVCVVFHYERGGEILLDHPKQSQISALVLQLDMYGGLGEDPPPYRVHVRPPAALDAVAVQPALARRERLERDLLPVYAWHELKCDVADARRQRNRVAAVRPVGEVQHEDLLELWHVLATAP